MNWALELETCGFGRSEAAPDWALGRVRVGRSEAAPELELGMGFGRSEAAPTCTCTLILPEGQN